MTFETYWGRAVPAKMGQRPVTLETSDKGKCSDASLRSSEYSNKQQQPNINYVFKPGWNAGLLKAAAKCPWTSVEPMNLHQPLISRLRWSSLSSNESGLIPGFSQLYTGKMDLSALLPCTRFHIGTQKSQPHVLPPQLLRNFKLCPKCNCVKDMINGLNMCFIRNEVSSGSQHRNDCLWSNGPSTSVISLRCMNKLFWKSVSNL